MKTKMTIEDLYDSPQYRSIVELTMLFQQKENGLRLLHYRWALIKDHDGIKKPFDKELIDFFSTTYPKSYIDSLDKREKRFGENKYTEYELFMETTATKTSLNYYYTLGLIEKDCFYKKYNTQNLSNFLEKLANNKKYNIFKKIIDIDGIPRYYIPIKNYEKIMTIHERRDLKEWINSWPDQKIFHCYQSLRHI